MEPAVGLRHDVDSFIGLRYGVARVAEIEEQVGARSTFYLRVGVLRKASRREVEMLRALAADGWRLGLHIDNTIDDPARLSPWHELALLEEVIGARVETATLHGGIYGHERKAWTAKLCSLGRLVLNLEGPGYCIHVPTVTLDWLVSRLGEPRAVEEAYRAVHRVLYTRGMVALLSHPEYFVVSVGRRLTLRARGYSKTTRLLKALEKIAIPAYTLARRRMVTAAYRTLLELLADSGYRLLPMEELVGTSLSI